MRVKSIGLTWIIVKNFKESVKFYTETVGLKLVEMSEEWGWAELEGFDEDGMRLGIAQQRSKSEDPIEPGQNGVVTFTIDNLELAIKQMEQKGATLVGKVEVVPGHVKMQSVRDGDGNLFQLVEMISEEDFHDHNHNGCCGGGCY